MRQWPKYLADQLIIGNPDSDLAIVCGWTPKQTVERRCRELGIEFAVIGNLYSARRGLTPLLRNVFLNPDIKRIALVGNDLSGSMETLFKLLDGRLQEEGWDVELGNYVVDEGLGRISENIDCDALDLLPTTVQTFPHFNRPWNLEEQLRQIDLITQDLSLNERPVTEFPEDEMITAQAWPGRYAGHLIHAKSVTQAWVKGLHEINRYGAISPTQYGVQQQELYDLVTVIDGVMDAKYDLTHLIADDWEMPITEQDYVAYRRQILTEASFEGVAYTYGAKIQPRVLSIVEKLKSNPDDRSAVISLWEEENYHTPKDNPCLTQLHFRRDPQGRLAMTATFRSHDYWNAYLMNVWALRELQQKIAEQDLGWQLGATIIVSQSAHTYEDCWEAVEELVGVALKNTFINPHPHGEWDPRGQFIIELNEAKTEIQVTLVAPEEVGGYALQTWTGNRAATLGIEILRDRLLTDPAHALYLGRQLQRAEDHLHGGLPFRQI